MSEPTFLLDVFLSHSAKDKAAVRPLAERLRTCRAVAARRRRKDGLKVWLDEWVLKPGDRIPAKIDLPSLRSDGGVGKGRQHSNFGLRTSDLGFAQPGMSANAFGSDWAQLACPDVASLRRRKAGTFRLRACATPRQVRSGDPLKQERRSIPLRLDDAPIKGGVCKGTPTLVAALGSAQTQWFTRRQELRYGVAREDSIA